MSPYGNYLKTYIWDDFEPFMEVKSVRHLTALTILLGTPAVPLDPSASQGRLINGGLMQLGNPFLLRKDFKKLTSKAN